MIMQLEEMYLKGLLGTDSVYLCHYFHLFTGSDIAHYYSIHGDFMGLRGCHPHSNTELIDLSKKVISGSPAFAPFFSGTTGNSGEGERFSPAEMSFQPSSRPVYDVMAMHEWIHHKLTRRQLLHINNKIVRQFGALSVRAQNALRNYLDNEIDIGAIWSDIFANEDFNPAQIRNAGAKTIPEIESFKDWIYNLVMSQPSYESVTFDIPESVVDCPSLFHKLEYMMKHKCIGDDPKRQKLAQTLYLYQSDAALASADLAAEFKRTNERVRQLRIAMAKRIVYQLYATHTPEEDFSVHGIDVNKDLVLISEDSLKSINATAERDFTIQLATLMLGVQLYATHQFPGDFIDAFIKRSNQTISRFTWKHIPLVNSVLVEAFRMNDFMQEINRLLHEKRDEDAYVAVADFYTRPEVQDDAVMCLRIRQVLIQVLNMEFSLQLSENNIVVVPATKRKSQWDMVEAAMEDIGKGCTVSEIQSRIQDLFPQDAMTEGQVKVVLNTNKPQIVTRIRSGIYFLSHWPEAASVDVRSIRDIAFDFLQEKKCPVSIHEVLDYLLPFYPSTSRESVRNNLYGDSDGRFVFYPNAYVGLRSETYSVAELA